MNPAWSVIFFTVLAGAGQGLFLMVLRAQAAGASAASLVGTCATSLTLLAVGLACSFFHLGHPLRAWRAVAMWRTSWLSREVIVLPLLIAAIAAWTFMAATGNGASPALDVVAIVLCFALWVCTGMIYACLRFLREWAHPLTVLNFTLIGWMSGATLFVAGWGGSAGTRAGATALDAAIVLTALAAIGRIASLLRNRALKPVSTPQSALGIANAKLRQMSRGTTAGSFNTREFFHGRSAAAVANVKWLALVLAFALPLALLVGARQTGSQELAVLAVAAQFAGLLAERWLFFAQANHPQNIYYQAVA